MKKALVLVLCLTLSGCAARVQHVTNIPTDANGKPVATEGQVKTYDTAVSNLHKMAASVSALRQAVIGLNKQGVFPDSPQYASTLYAIGNIDKLELAAVDYLNKVPSTWSADMARTIEAQVNAILGSIDTLNKEGLIGIKNLNSQQQVSNLVKDITSLAHILLSLSQGVQS